MPPITDHDSGVTYEPYTDEPSGAVGFKATHLSTGQVEYIMLNPSGGSDDGVPTVFLYLGPTGEPGQDEAAHHYVMFYPDHQGND